jgi:hypothetical protein
LEDTLRSTLIKRGRERLGKYGADDYYARLTNILEEAKSLVR